MPKTERQVVFQNRICRTLNTLWEISQLKDCGGSNPVAKLMQKMIRIIPPRQYAHFMNMVAKRYNHRLHSNKVNMQHFFLRPKLASDFDEIYGNGIEVTFEGRHFNAPKNIDAYLTRTYGDYMQYPPVEEQVQKHPNHVVMREEYRKKQEKRRIAVILAGGTGSRIGAGIPKQFIKIQGKPILAFTLEAFQDNPLIDAIEIVCHKDWTKEVESICETSGITKKKWICTEVVDTYQIQIEIQSDIYEGWLCDIFTKTICEAKNRNQLMKAVAMAEELGLKEGTDFFLIKDNCLTELEPEEVGEDGIGRTLTCIGFRPLPDEIAHQISRKYQLYR